MSKFDKYLKSIKESVSFDSVKSELAFWIEEIFGDIPFEILKGRDFRNGEKVYTFKSKVKLKY